MGHVLSRDLVGRGMCQLVSEPLGHILVFPVGRRRLGRRGGCLVKQVLTDRPGSMTVLATHLRCITQ